MHRFNKHICLLLKLYNTFDADNPKLLSYILGFLIHRGYCCCKKRAMTTITNGWYRTEHTQLQCFMKALYVMQNKCFYVG